MSGGASKRHKPSNKKQTRARGTTKGDWRNCWVSKNTPWSQSRIDPALREVFPSLKREGLPRSGAALVPLCGDSRSVAFLKKRGLDVVGVDFIPLSLQKLLKRDFPGTRVRRRAAPLSWRLPGLELVAQDIFAFRRPSAFDLIYDRAALVALPPSRRRRYAKLLRDALRASGLLVVVYFTSSGAKLPGPPFEITPREVRALFTGLKSVFFKRTRVSPPEPRFAEQGVRAMNYYVSIFKKAAPSA